MIPGSAGMFNRNMGQKVTIFVRTIGDESIHAANLALGRARAIMSTSPSTHRDFSCEASEYGVVISILMMIRAFIDYHEHRRITVGGYNRHWLVQRMQSLFDELATPGQQPGIANRRRAKAALFRNLRPVLIADAVSYQGMDR